MRRMLRMTVMLSLASAPAFAQNETAPGWTPALEIRALSSGPQGTQANVSNRLPLLTNEPMAQTMWTRGNLCALGGGDPAAMALAGAPPPPNVWKLTGEYLGEQDGRHRIRVTSGFARLDGRDASATTTQTLALREGDNVTLDVLSGAIGTGCFVHVVAFDARLVMQATDPALERARYSADLWLVHRDPDGRERREHLVTNVSAGGSAMPFMFSPLEFPIPKVDPRQGNVEATIHVSGLLRVRPRGNGDVTIDLDVNGPLFALDDPDKRPQPLTMPPKRMTLTVKNDETAAVDFPAPSSGYHSIALATPIGTSRAGIVVRPITPASPPPPTEALEVKGNRLVLYPIQFFKGHSTRLLITLKPLP